MNLHKHSGSIALPLQAVAPHGAAVTAASKRGLQAMLLASSTARLKGQEPQRRIIRAARYRGADAARVRQGCIPSAAALSSRRPVKTQSAAGLGCQQLLVCHAFGFGARQCQLEQWQCQRQQ